MISECVEYTFKSHQLIVAIVPIHMIRQMLTIKVRFEIKKKQNQILNEVSHRQILRRATKKNTTKMFSKWINLWNSETHTHTHTRGTVEKGKMKEQ